MEHKLCRNLWIRIRVQGKAIARKLHLQSSGVVVFRPLITAIRFLVIELKFEGQELLICIRSIKYLFTPEIEN